MCARAVRKVMDVYYSILYLIWSFASAVILFNLLIAMMSASFQEVLYFNVYETALQRAHVCSLPTIRSSAICH